MISQNSNRWFNFAIYSKEAQETKHWLRMLATCYQNEKPKIGSLWREAQELTLIFQKIGSSLKIKQMKIE